MRPHLPALAAALALGLSACKTPEQRLVDRRHELRATLDGLYGAFGGSDLARAGQGLEAQGAPPAEAGLVGRLMGEADRSYFEQQCLAIGRGERPFSLSGKLDTFLKDPEHARDCRRAAELALDVAALERELATR